MKIPLSVCVITKNEERHIRECLESVKGRVEEIVVLDSGSEDRTQAIAREFTDRVHERPFSNFSEQKNACAALASRDWVLVLDADERMEPDAWPFLEGLFSVGEPKAHAAYAFPRRTISADGRFHLWINHYPSFVDRLYDRRRCRLVQEVHEWLRIDGTRGFVPHHILHAPKLSASTEAEKRKLYGELKARMAKLPEPSLGARISRKWEALAFATGAFWAMGLFWKGPEYAGFLFRWYAVSLLPFLRPLTYLHKEIPPPAEERSPAHAH